MRTGLRWSAHGLALACVALGGCFLFGQEDAPEAPGECDPTLQSDWHECDGGQDGGCDDPDAVCRLDFTAECPCGGFDCEAPRRCMRIEGDGMQGPLAACTRDVDCRSGRCQPGSGRCETPCDPGVTVTSHCGGLACVAVEQDGRLGHLCAPDDGAGGAGGGGGAGGAPEGAICARDGDCPDGQLCAVHDANGLDEPLLPGAWTACVHRPATDDAFAPCDDALTDPARNALCPTRGFCVEACEDNIALACEVRSCARPCHLASDCPFRFECGGDHNWNVREGAEALQICQLHDATDVGWGCFDDADCCVFGTDEDPRQEDGGLCCTVTGPVGQRICTAPPFRTRCGIREYDGAPTPHVVTRCRAPEPLIGATRLPGEPCETPEQCSTGVCAPDGMGGGLCVQLCSLGDEAIARRSSAATALADPCDPFGEGGGRRCELQVVRGLGYDTPLCLPVCGVPGAGTTCAEPGAAAP